MLRVTGLILMLVISAWVLAETPQQRAMLYFSDIQAKHFTQAATHIDPDQLEDFRKQMAFYKKLDPVAQRQFIRGFFGEEATAESLDRLSDTEFFAAILSFVVAQAEQSGGLYFDDIDILGGVPEGDDIVHLVTRSRIRVGELDVRGMEVVSLRREGDGWRIILSGKIKGLPKQLNKSLAN